MLSQASLQEDVLSRSEKAVIRGVYRASQLADIKSILNRTLLHIPQESQPMAKNSLVACKIKSIQDYLDTAIVNALVSTKVPAIKQANSQPSNEA